MFFNRLIISFILIAVSATLGLWARYQAVPYWEKHKDIFFVEGRPIFTSFDGYYFARLAEDYKLGVFDPGGKDKLRNVPDYEDYPEVLPFYSWFFAKLSSITGKPIENLTFWFIPIFAVLVVIPLVLLFVDLGIPMAALGGAIAAAISLIYVIRTSINRLDTDSIVIFSFFSIPLAVYFFVKTGNKRKKYFYLLLVAVFSNLFYWGYIHPGLNLLFWLSSVLFLSYPYLKFWYSNRKNQSLKELFKQYLIKDIALLALAFNPLILIEGIYYLLFRLWIYIVDFGKPLYGDFPNVQISIAELQKLDLSRLAKLTLGSEWLLFLGFTGAGLFIFLRFRVFLLLLPTFLIGILSIKGASRFAMFLAPILGIGFGFLFDFLGAFLKKHYPNKSWLKITFYTFSFLLITLVLTLSNRVSFQYIPQPIMTSSLAEAFIEIGKQTPPDAWIYTWWDYGYAIQYYARRATFHDGGSQFSPKTYFVALGFTSESPLVGYNITETLTICGEKCIKKLLKEGYTSEQIKDMFVKGTLIKDKKINRPVYWIFTPDLIGKFYWISYFGSWDFKTLKGKHHPIYSAVCIPRSIQYYVCNIDGRPILFDTWNLRLIMGRNNIVPLKYFAIRTPEKLDVEENPNYPFGEALEKVYTYRKNFYAWFLTDSAGFKSNFNQMYILRNWNKNYFEKIEGKFPNFLFFKVR